MFDRPTGRIDSTSIYPGKSLTDVLIFEPPVRDIQYLNLELPGKNVGVDGCDRCDAIDYATFLALFAAEPS